MTLMVLWLFLEAPGYARGGLPYGLPMLYAIAKLINLFGRFNVVMSVLYDIIEEKNKKIFVAIQHRREHLWR